MPFTVRILPAAYDDLGRLYDHVLDREFASPSGDLSLPDRALAAIHDGLRMLERYPFTCRKAQGGALGPLVREHLIPFGHTGYVVLFEILDKDTVQVAAVRHQRDDDYH